MYNNTKGEFLQDQHFDSSTNKLQKKKKSEKGTLQIKRDLKYIYRTDWKEKTLLDPDSNKPGEI